MIWLRECLGGGAPGQAPLLLVGASEQRRLVCVGGDLVALALPLGGERRFAAQRLGSLGDRGGGLVGRVDLGVLDLAVERESVARRWRRGGGATGRS